MRCKLFNVNLASRPDPLRHTANLDQLLETSFFDVVLESERDVEEEPKLTDGSGYGHYGEGEAAEVVQVETLPAPDTTSDTTSFTAADSVAQPPVQNNPNQEVASLRQIENAKLLELRGNSSLSCLLNDTKKSIFLQRIPSSYLT